MTEGVFDIRTKQQYVPDISTEELVSYLESAEALTEA
jgi:hypothetical protein